MTTNNHTAISTGAAANASTFNTPLGALDAAIGAAVSTLSTTAKTLVGSANEIYNGAAGGASATAQLLADWATSEAYELTAITVDADEVVTTATVKWPDASAGTFTTTTKNSTFLAVDAYTISHTASGKTVTQAAVTRNASGSVTTKPAVTVA